MEKCLQVKWIFYTKTRKYWIFNFIEEKYIKEKIFNVLMETITIPKIEFEQMQQELDILRKTSLYKRLLEFEKNIADGRIFTRKDLGF